MTAWLTPDEVAELTARKRCASQCAMLAQMGISYRPNGAGRPLVERAAVLRYLGKPERVRDTPNWDALDAA